MRVWGFPYQNLQRWSLSAWFIAVLLVMSSLPAHGASEKVQGGIGMLFPRDSRHASGTEFYANFIGSSDTGGK
jgi:hypothetical protein